MLDKCKDGVYDVSMKRVNFHLTAQQIKNLKKYSAKNGISVAEFIRRLVDEFFKTKGEK